MKRQARTELKYQSTKQTFNTTEQTTRNKKFERSIIKIDHTDQLFIHERLATVNYAITKVKSNMAEGRIWIWVKVGVGFIIRRLKMTPKWLMISHTSLDFCVGVGHPVSCIEFSGLYLITANSQSECSISGSIAGIH